MKLAPASTVSSPRGALCSPTATANSAKDWPGSPGLVGASGERPPKTEQSATDCRWTWFHGQAGRSPRLGGQDRSQGDPKPLNRGDVNQTVRAARGRDQTVDGASPCHLTTTHYISVVFDMQVISQLRDLLPVPTIDFVTSKPTSDDTRRHSYSLREVPDARNTRNRIQLSMPS